jgi:hypothetical protein
MKGFKKRRRRITKHRKELNFFHQEKYEKFYLERKEFLNQAINKTTYLFSDLNYL